MFSVSVIGVIEFWLNVANLLPDPGGPELIFRLADTAVAFGTRCMSGRVTINMRICATKGLFFSMQFAGPDDTHSFSGHQCSQSISFWLDIVYEWLLCNI
jgi:hypothetical protein